MKFKKPMHFKNTPSYKQRLPVRWGQLCGMKRVHMLTLFW
jgi:hypothetical protein